jgi:hypothetical protein
MWCTRGKNLARLFRLWPELCSDSDPHRELSLHPESSIESWKSTVRDPAACCRRDPAAGGRRKSAVGCRMSLERFAPGRQVCFTPLHNQSRDGLPYPMAPSGVEPRLRKSWIRGAGRRRDHDRVKLLFECGAFGLPCEKATVAGMNQSRNGSALVRETGGRVYQGMLARSSPACSRPHR